MKWMNELFENQKEKLGSRTLEQLLEASYYEIGHFLIYHLLSLKFNYFILPIVSIIPQENSIQEGKPPNGYKNLVETYIFFTENVEKTEEYYRNMIAFYSGGFVALKLFGYNENYSQYSEKDYGKILIYAIEIIKNFYTNILFKDEMNEKIMEIIQEEEIRASKILALQKEKIDLLAQALLQNKILLGEQLEQLYEGTLLIGDL